MPTPTPSKTPDLTADEIAEREWPVLRSRLIDAAAALDRLDRAGPGQAVSQARAQAEQVLTALLTPGDADRAERVLRLLSREYDPGWAERFSQGEQSADPANEA